MPHVGQASRPLGIVVVGTGTAGKAAVVAIASRPDMSLIGCVTTDPRKVGVDVGVLCGLQPQHVAATHADGASELLRAGEVDVVVYAGLNDPPIVVEWLSRAAQASVDCISVAGPVHPRTCLGPDATATLDGVAAAHGARLMSTGVNPGFLLDVLPLACASLSPGRRIIVAARRHSEIREWGASVLTGYGLGQDPASWETDHPYVTLVESARLLADGLGWEIDDVIECYRPVVASEDRYSDGLGVPCGAIAGFDVTCLASMHGGVVIDLRWTGEFCCDQARDGGTPEHEITISGDVEVRCRVSGEFLSDTYPATVARALNAIRPLRSLPAGLYRPDQVPLTPLGSQGASG
jgi:hypothetical protein